MNEEEISALLGRPLTTVEANNFDLYIDIATENLNDLLCITTTDVTDEARTFDTRWGYSTAFLDIFRSVSEVKLNDEVVEADTYSLRQWNKREASWFNSLVFDNKFRKDDVLEVTADWGFEAGSGDESSLPADLQLLLAGLFDLISRKNKYDGSVESKRVEDFSISFRADSDLDDEFYAKYNKTISKYSLCDIPNIQHGKIRYGHRF